MPNLTEQEKEDIRATVESEGFDYYFTLYTSPQSEGVTDPEYQRLWENYRKAHEELSTFLGIK
jgi:hypothetical protein